MAMRFMSIEDMEEYLKPIVQTEPELKILDREKLRGEPIDRLVYNAVFHESAEQRGITRVLIKEIAAKLGALPASIQGFYEAMGRGDVTGVTVPAVNIRGMTYDTARALFRTGIKNDSCAFIFEIAKSEISYTFQQPAEYAAVILAAAVKEGYILITVMAVIASMIAAYFYLRVIVMMYFHDGEKEEAVMINRGMGALVTVSSLAIILIGFYPSTLMHLALDSIPF